MICTKRLAAGSAAALAATLALGACASSVSGATGGSTADGETITLSYAFFAPAASFPSVQMEEWAKEVNERTDGQVEVDLFVGGTLLGAGDIYDGVSEGVVDVGLDSPAYDTGRFPFSSVINLPIGIENSKVGSATFLDLLTEYEPAEFDDYQIITAFTTEPAYIQTSAPVTSRAELRGLTLRSAGAGVPILEGLGASAVGMSMADVAEALNTGVVDGYLSSREVLKDFGLAENVSYVTDYPYGVSNSFVAVMDKEKFDALPQDVQDVIMELRGEMMTFASDFHDTENVEAALQWAADEHGVEVVEVDEADRPEWDAVGEARIEDWIASQSGADFDAQEVVDRMRELAEEHAGNGS